MNLILLSEKDFVSDTHVLLGDRRAQHVIEVHRATPGQKLKVGILNGGIGEGQIEEIHKKSVKLAVQISDPPPPVWNIHFILALPRPQTLKKVLETAGTFGVKSVSLIPSERVQKSYFHSKLLKDQAWLRHLYLGMEQGGKTITPHLDLISSFREIFQREVLSRATKLIAHPSSLKNLWDISQDKIKTDEPFVCAIGPEGGWLPQEVESFVAHGFQEVALGNTVWRVESAVTAFLSQWEFLRSRKS